MAALYGQRFVFVHLPKTGGKWVKSALKAAGHLHNRDLNDAHEPTPAITNPNLVSFTFIRHPATWLASWFAYCERSGWIDQGRMPDAFNTGRCFDRMVWETAAIDHEHGFENWARELEHYHPGFVADYFAPYMASVQHVGKQETLRRDLERIIGPIPELEPINVGGNVPKVSASMYEFISTVEPLGKLGYAPKEKDVVQERHPRRAKAIRDRRGNTSGASRYAR